MNFFFYNLAITVSIRIVADCVTLSCQDTEKLKRAESLDFTGFARLSLQKVIKKVIKYLSEGILIEKLNRIKGGNLVHMMLKRNSIRFEFNWHDDIKR